MSARRWSPRAGRRTGARRAPGAHAAAHRADGVSLLSLRVAYIHSSEEARETAAARERAPAKAQEALRRVKRGLGGRHDKTRRQVDGSWLGPPPGPAPTVVI